MTLVAITPEIWVDSRHVTCVRTTRDAVVVHCAGFEHSSKPEMTTTHLSKHAQAIVERINKANANCN